MSEKDNFKIKIPEELFFVKSTGYHNQTNKGFDLAYLTPNGKDQAAEKRKDTGRRWASSSYYDKTPKPKPEETIIKNEPLCGFKIAKEVKRTGWNGGNVVWRIEDPRGFTVEIQSGNLMNILMCSTISEGEIDIKCVWGREGAGNILLPICTEEYKQAIRNTKGLDIKIDYKNVPFGSTVLLKNGMKVIWLGKYFVQNIEFGSINENKFEDVKHIVSSNPKFCFYEETNFNYRGTKDEIHCFSKFDLLEVLNETLSNEEEIQKIIADLLKNGVRVKTGTDIIYNTIAFTKTSEKVLWKFFLEEIKDKPLSKKQIEQENEIIRIARNEYNFYILKNYNDHYYYGHDKHKNNISFVCVDKFSENNLTNIIEKDNNYRSSWYPERFIQKVVKFSIEECKLFDYFKLKIQTQDNFVKVN